MNEKGDHRLQVHVLGGTIACGESKQEVEFDSRRHKSPDEAFEIVVEPVQGKIREMVTHDVSPAVRNEFAQIKCTEERKIIDSAEYDVKHLMRIVHNVRTHLEENGTSMVIPCGTDSAASLTHCLAEGIPPELLGDNSLVVVVSQTHASPNRPDGHVGPFYDSQSEPVFNLTNSIYLTTRKECRGRIGLCCGRVLHAPRGLQKVDAVGTDRYAFYYRFPEQAKADNQIVPNWQFESPRPEDLPRGKKHKYVLASGIETCIFGPTSDYQNLANAMRGMLLASPSGLQGMIVQAPGTSNLRQGRRDLMALNDAAEFGADHGVPMVLISDPLQAQWHNMSRDEDEEDVVYGGALAVVRSVLDEAAGGKTSIIDGEQLSRTEATLLTSAAVARAREQHHYSGREIVEYIERYLRLYQQYIRTGSDEESKGDQ